jgi:uncharacterized protein (TIGR03437 family)
LKQSIFVTAIVSLCLGAHAQGLRIVNAASLSAVSLAPGSIATIFGTNLAAGVAVADNVVTPPATLGGVSVTIGGSAASLFYVSPTQINLVINPATPVGSETVTITSPKGTQTLSATISSNAPPGLFSLSGSGTRDGAILNAVTFLLGAFGVSPSSSTYLALYATGLNPSATPSVTIGGVAVQVTSFSAAPCCDGLQQINVLLPASLEGAGRVPVVVTTGGNASNTVEVVLLPQTGHGESPDESPNGNRSRELAGLASVPGTSLVLVTDENDDVVRVVDVKARQVTHVITLPQGSNPQGIAVTANGGIAVVTESGAGKAAILDLVKFTVSAEVATAPGARRVAVTGNQAIVVNSDSDSVSILNLATNALSKTIAVGRAPAGVAVDAASQKAYVTNEGDGSVSVLDLGALSVSSTLQLGASVRPEAIVIAPGTGMAFLTAPAAGPDGQLIQLNLSTGAHTTVSANPDRSGGSSDVVFYNSNLYLANQAGGSVSVIPFKAGSLGTPIIVKADLGARALAIDVKDNLLVVSNEASGNLALVDLDTNKVAGRVNAVHTQMSGDDEKDDHNDRNNSANAPVIQSLSAASGKAGSSFSLTITGTNLTGATDVQFVQISGHESGNGMKGANDFTVSAIQVNAAGTQLTAHVSIAASAKAGPRLVKVQSPNGESSTALAAANTFTVTP